LYRGLKKPFRPELVGAGQGAMFGTDFTDCPFAALQFAAGSRGVVLVVDVPDDNNRRSPWVSEDLWLQSGPKRLMIWGKFDEHIVAVIPAKDLRTELRRAGVSRGLDGQKAAVLERVIKLRIATSRPPLP
jgi:hypothetical protein